MNTDNLAPKEYDILLALWRDSVDFNDRLDTDELTGAETDALQSLEERGIVQWSPTFTHESQHWFGDHLTDMVMPGMKAAEERGEIKRFPSRYREEDYG